MGNTVTICFANNKGGSGKSTSCSNVGAALAGMGKKVLMVDGDMQLNLSLSFFSEEEVLEMAAGEKNLYYAIGHQSDLSDFIVHTKYENLDLVPSSTLMSSVEYELFTKWQREFILRKCLQKVKDSGVYDYILIDAPPTLGGWVMNILCASDYVLFCAAAAFFELHNWFTAVLGPFDGAVYTDKRFEKIDSFHFFQCFHSLFEIILSGICLGYYDSQNL